MLINWIEELFKQGVQQRVDAYVNCEWILLMDFSQKFIKNYASLTFVDSSKILLSYCTNNKSEMGFVMPTGLPGEAVQRILVYARS